MQAAIPSATSVPVPVASALAPVATTAPAPAPAPAPSAGGPSSAAALSSSTSGAQPTAPAPTNNASNSSNSTAPTGGTFASNASAKTRHNAPPPPPPAPWEPRSINLYKRENMTLIGEGTYGSVWLAKGPNGEKVALKKIRKEKKEGFPITAIREIKLLKALKHPNIVCLKDVVSSHMPGREGDVFMCFQFLDHDLTGLLEAKIPLSDALVKYYLKSILEGLAYLHSRQVLHRDIKGANILVSNNGDVRIADMGLARGMAKGGYTNRVVTLWYRAPELLLGSCDYDAKIDTWSVGCLMAELLTRGTVLFPGSTELQQLNLIYAACGTPDETSWPGVSKLRYFEQFKPKPQKRTLRAMFASQKSHQAVDLLDKLLTLNPAQRLSAEQALDHEYFFEAPLPLEPHHHPNFQGNHHEFGSKQKRKQGGNVAAAQQPAGQNANNRPNQPASQAGGPIASGDVRYQSRPAGPAPFDRMQVSSHPQFGQPPPNNYANAYPPAHHSQQAPPQPYAHYPPYAQQPPQHAPYPSQHHAGGGAYRGQQPPHPRGSGYGHH